MKHREIAVLIERLQIDGLGGFPVGLQFRLPHRARFGLVSGPESVSRRIRRLLRQGLFASHSIARRLLAAGPAGEKIIVV